ncbi:hypothetical protein RvY_10106 [Ramazzottius varieornatus]|uniref:Uncharacterized protein n=1 Tax=Ramazzottius varieornatus TaxID=947166 RepID=A0A1D1VJF8_RAMVA|nr:hypothetical protein RvY_10106 [Ramazzottius varieornatus]
MTTYAHAWYGVGLSGLVVVMIVAFVSLVRYRRSFSKNVPNSKSTDLHLSPITPTTIVVQMKEANGQSHRPDIPPDYESVMKGANAAHQISLPPPTPDQMGTFTTHYVTTPSKHTPPPENTVLYLSGPLSELH